MRAYSTPFALVAASLVLVACSKPEPPPEPVRAVRTQEVAPSAAALQLEYAAEIRAQTESRLGFRVGGKLVERRVNLGDTVRTGQVLARLDPQDLRLGQDAAQAAVVAARVNLEQAEADFKRFKELREQGFISSAELERRETAYRSAQAQYRQANAQAQAQGNQAEYSVLRADAPGVITSVDAEPGMVLGAGTPVVRLAHEGPRQAWFFVPEDRVDLIRRVQAAQHTVEVRLWSDRDRPLQGRIHEVAAAADPATRTYLVKATLGRADVKLGQTAAVRLQVPAAEAAVRLPLAAVFEQRGRSTVWVFDPDSATVKPQAVQVAGADGNSVLISAGLQPGQQVVTAGVHTLTEGQKVKLLTAAPGSSPSASAGTEGGARLAGPAVANGLPAGQ